MGRSRSVRITNARLWVTAACLASLIAITGGVPSTPAHASSVGVDDYSPIAYDLTPEVCDDLGRAWETFEGQSGCSRLRCTTLGARMVGDYNTEGCMIGARAYGENLESRTCTRLRRVWVPQVNRCLTNLDRASVGGVVPSASQCSRAATTYVFMAPALGNDLCLTAPRAAAYAQQARSQRISLAEAVFRRSRELCDAAPRYDWRASECTRLKRGENKRKDRAAVLVMGDSVTWRAADEMTRDRASWEVDGQPGTSIHSAAARYRDYAKLHTSPGVFVIALGTNGVHNAETRARLAQTAALVPRTTRVVFVTPYRNPAIYGAARGAEMDERAQWMRQIQANRPHTCIAPWHDVAEADPSLLIDGVHQTDRGAQVFADTIARAVSTCR